MNIVDIPARLRVDGTALPIRNCQLLHSESCRGQQTVDPNEVDQTRVHFSRMVLSSRGQAVNQRTDRGLAIWAGYRIALPCIQALWEYAATCLSGNRRDIFRQSTSGCSTTLGQSLGIIFQVHGGTAFYDHAYERYTLVSGVCSKPARSYYSE